MLNDKKFLFFFTLSAGIYAGAIVFYHYLTLSTYTEEFLIALLIPIFYCAYHYTTRIYVYAVLISLLLSVLVISQTVSNVEASFHTLTIIFISGLISCEMVFRSLSYRHEYEQAVHGERDLFNQITETVPVSIIMVNRQGQIVFVNRMIEELFGIPKNLLLNAQFNNTHFHLTDWEGKPVSVENTPFQRVKKDQKPIINMIYCAEKLDGKQIILSINGSPLLTTLGEIESVIFSLEDITERWQTEKALEESEKKFKELAEMLPALLVEFDNRGIVTYVNQYGYQMTGYTIEDYYRGFKVSDLMVPDERERLLSNIKRILQGEVLGPNEYCTLKKNGELLFVMAQSSPFYRDNKVAGFRSVLIDINDLKKAEVALRESEEKFRKLFLAIPMGIYLFKLNIADELILVDTNPIARQMLGYSNSEEIKFPIEKLFPAFAATDIPLHCKEAATTGISFSKMDVHYEDSRIHGFYDIYAFQVQPSFVAVILNEITHRKNLEEQLRQSQKMECIGFLAGGIAHDFNNLLTGILGYADLLIESQLPDDPSIVEIKNAAMRAAALTRQLLAFSRKQILEPKLVNLNELILNLDKMLRRLIGENIELLIIPAHNLDMVKSDPAQIEQVITNLVVNARDAMPDGGKIIIETANISIDEQICYNHPNVELGKYVRIEISDTGCGIKEEIMNHIFEPFFTTKEQGKGTGLGLSMVYGTIKQSGGTIEVISNVGSGSIFSIYLPIAIETDKNIPLVLAKKQPCQSGKETILVVEDEETVRNLIKNLLPRKGYSVIIASNGEDAIRIAGMHTSPIHLLLTDIILPKMSGDETARQISARIPSIKVLYMSGYTDDLIVHHGVLDEGIAFIHKPFTNDDLIHKIRETLDKPLITKIEKNT